MASPFQKRWVRVLAIVVAVLVAVVFVLSLVLDSILTKRAQAEAATLSQQLGRPVSIGRVSTSFLTGLGATVSGLEVGGAPDEGVPLAQVKEVGVKVAALRALFSMGKDIVVRSIEVAEPMVNVVRLPDGTTNLERVQSRLAEQEKSKAGRAGEQGAQRSLGDPRRPRGGDRRAGAPGGQEHRQDPGARHLGPRHHRRRSARRQAARRRGEGRAA